MTEDTKPRSGLNTLPRNRKSNYSAVIHASSAELQTALDLIEATDPELFESVYRTREGKPPITFDVEIFQRLRNIKKACDAFLALFRRPETTIYADLSSDDGKVPATIIQQ